MRFIIFLAVFISIYSSFHLYAFLKLRRALSLHLRAGAIIAVFMAFMVAAPILIRTAERHGFELCARFLAHIGYTWMGFLFVFVSVAFVLDIYRFLIHGGRQILAVDLSAITLSQQYSFYIAVLLAVIITVYGAFEAISIRTEHVTIRSEKIPKYADRTRIVQISDVHLGLMVGEKRMARILNRVRAAKPDILVSTGDLFDGQMDSLAGLASMLKEIPTTYGKFAITGNHEFYAGLDRFLDFAEKAGFIVLQQESLNVSGWLNIAGVDDVTAKRYGQTKNVSEKALLAKLPPGQFTLLLKHRPWVDEETPGLFDLQLSGHTHKGQIFPFSLITMIYYPHIAGLRHLEKNSRLYVSRGSGTWGPPIRFLAAPEVTLIELVHEDKNFN
jgi:hypothetical protein